MKNNKMWMMFFFFQAVVTDKPTLKKSEFIPNRSRTYDLLVYNLDALPLILRRPAGIKAIKLGLKYIYK